MAEVCEFKNTGLCLVPSEVLKRYKKARQLWLWHNRLTFLPDDFTKLTKLQELYLNNNNFVNFPSVLCGMNKLKILDLSNNFLEYIPTEVSQMGLVRLVLSNNQLLEFPHGVTEMKELQRLWLGWNRISCLPANIANMKTLTVMKVNNNQIQTIPDEMCQLTHLEEFDIECNPLTDVSINVVTYLQGLKVANYHGNHIRNQQLDPTPVSMMMKEESMPSPISVTVETNDDNDLYDCYKMNTNPLGIAVIISNEKFDYNPNDPKSQKLEFRQGTEVDVGKLDAVFKILQFNVLKWHNLSSHQMIQVLQSVGCMDHTKYSSLVVCILSHGAQGEVAGSDGVTVSIQRLAEPFTAARCLGLIKKPKLFFIQACQGAKQQLGIPTPLPSHSHLHLTTKPGFPDALPSEGTSVQETRSTGHAVTRGNINSVHQSHMCQASGITNTAAFGSRHHVFMGNYNSTSHTTMSHQVSGITNSTHVVPNEADFLYGFCTAPGYEAYRYKDQSKGSWYISKLTEVLEREAGRKHLLEILTLVNNEVSKEGNPNFKQIPAPQYTLTKKLYFRYSPTGCI
ncbi:uncharacterized protein LOC144440062 [Glandiceps talaboti]